MSSSSIKPNNKKKKLESGGVSMDHVNHIREYFRSKEFSDLLDKAVDRAIEKNLATLDKLSESSKVVIQQLEVELLKQQNKLKEIEGTIQKSRKGGEEEDPAEAKERRRSVVLLNIPESKSYFQHERNMLDVTSVNILLRHLNLGCQPMALYRMGKERSDGKPRLLKLVLASSQMQRELLKVAPQLKSFDTRGHPPVYIRRSMSKQELEEFREERKKIKQSQVIPSSANSEEMIIDPPASSSVNVTPAPKN
ncbi:hypothetical protein GCK72_018230 [Caenorhabditis remanei]|uniref:Uncharacterized protein n=1 Tax=Caenorhabditis remanei TaxID=31234 RepID=A0A6A5GA16_CAERE|nr:hypothetical protein GCK72_018230 [Caenorhabditis remanei]KAF1751676.1 hypothetical protein GCK72_018230 [Caenorhabditis remanei]